MIRTLLFSFAFLIGIQTVILPTPVHADTGLESLFIKRVENEYFEAGELYRRGQYSRALRKVDNYLNDYPHDLQGLTLQAWCLIKMDRLEEAKTVINGILYRAPQAKDALLAAGVYYRKIGEPEKAMEFYQKVLNQDPNDAQALNSIVTVALQSGEVKKAVHFGEKAYQHDPENPTINANLAIAYHYDGDFKKRDLYKNNARRLDYHDMSKLYKIFSGRASVMEEKESLKSPYSIQ